MGNTCSGATSGGHPIGATKHGCSHGSPEGATNPLCPPTDRRATSGTAETPPQATDTDRYRQHQRTTATADTALPPGIARRAARIAAAHRSASVVARADTGYELPEPPLAEHLGRMERRAAIAISVHGHTADPCQFTPEAVPAAVMARSVELCREWLAVTP